MAENKEQFKNYRVGEVIGRGRFASVYKAEKLDVRKTVALKVLNPDVANRTDIREQFRDQARQQAKLSHPRLVRVEDLREEHGQFFVAMEYMPLGSLRSWVTQNGMVASFRQVAMIVEDVAEALDYLHGRSLVHGDVKPGNILLMEDPNQKNAMRAKLSDLRLPLASDVSETVSENLVELTPEYISPEQAGGAPATPLSDQYSLGAVAYELLTGQPPFANKSQVDLYIDHQKTRPPSLQSLNPQVTPELEQVILRTLEKSPDSRYSSCGGFARALRAAVVLTEQKRLTDLLVSAERLLEKREFSGARTALKDALLIQPENEKAAELLVRLEQQEGVSKNYEQAVEALREADAKAHAIRKAAPDYPDDAGYLDTFAPPPPPLWKQFRDRWSSAGQLAGFLLLFSLICLLSATIWIETAGSRSIQPTLVAMDRTSTHTSTSTPTPTFTPTPTPTFTSTSTLTFTPTATPTITLTPIGLIDFDASGWIPISDCPGIDLPCWTDSPSGEYVNYGVYLLRATQFTVDQNWKNPYLVYRQKYETERCCDYIELIINGTLILKDSGSSDWEQVAIDLNPYKGQPLSIRFRLRSDHSQTADGWYLSDIRIVQNPSSGDLLSMSIPTPYIALTLTSTPTSPPTSTPIP
jgi:serine/threonine-protein kinase